jgi:hypothetical protein
VQTSARAAAGCDNGGVPLGSEAFLLQERQVLDAGAARLAELSAAIALEESDDLRSRPGRKKAAIGELRTCAVCGARLAAGSLYCSQRCFNRARTKGRDEASDRRVCEGCGAGYVRPQRVTRSQFAKRRFCGQRCPGKAAGWR